MGTIEGGKQSSQKLIKKHGRTKDGKSVFHVKIGAKGGKASSTGGFFGDRELARRAASKGGSVPWTEERRKKHSETIKKMWARKKLDTENSTSV